MASYHHHLLRHTTPRLESPAKVFAKLKSRVQSEEMFANESLCNVRDKQLKSPRKRSKSPWIDEGTKENQRTGWYRHEAQALTVSPISSPQKTFGHLYSGINSSIIPVEDRGHGRSPRKTFLESTSVSQALPVISRKRIHSETPKNKGQDGFSRTPLKTPYTEQDHVKRLLQGDTAAAAAALDRHMSPGHIYSPMRKRLRKRTLEPQEFIRVSSSTKDFNNGGREEKRTFSAPSEDNARRVRVFSAEPSEMNQFSHRPVLPLRATPNKRLCVALDKIPPMSPAKMFAYMKERESTAELQERHKVSSITTRLLDKEDFHPCRDSPSPIVQSAGEMEDSVFMSPPESAAPVSWPRVVESPESSQSDADPPRDTLVPDPPARPVLLEDSLVLNTPRVSIPKREAVFKRNKWPLPSKFPSESVIHLKKWFLRGNHKGLFVDGIHREDNIPWNSNIIVNRVSNSVVKTVSGSVYVLVGKMNLDTDSKFPKWFLKKFVRGFPPDWKELHNKFLSESKGETKRGSEGKGVRAKTKSNTPKHTLSVEGQGPDSLKTPDSCPPSASSCFSTKVSRSGRVIKPPLEYWKGGRVIVDAYMNVTIHECYETSLCAPQQVDTTMSERASEKPATRFLRPSEDREQHQSSNKKEEASAPLRKVKTPHHKSKSCRLKPAQQPSHSHESPAESLSSTAPQRSKRQETTRRSVRASTVKRALTSSPESPPGHDRTSQESLSEERSPVRRRQPEKTVHRKKSKKVLEKTRPSRAFPLSESEEESAGKEFKKKTIASKNSDFAKSEVKRKQSKSTKISPPIKPLPGKSTKISPPIKPLPKSAQSSNKRKTGRDKPSTPQEEEEDDNAWTEAELMKLQEAVSFYPKHITGYWAKVARTVGTRTAEQCHMQHTSRGTSQTPAKKSQKAKREKIKEAPKNPVQPVISARLGTYKRKQQVREFLEAMPRDNVEDVFSSVYMQSKRFQMPSMSPGDDHDFALSELQPVTPMSSGYPEAKTPQCLYITPGMMGSPSGTNNDKYVYQLQKKMKKNRFNVCKQAPSKKYTPTPSTKQHMKRCGDTENDTFLVWEMFPGNEGAPSESGEEEDYYFSDNH